MARKAFVGQCDTEANLLIGQWKSFTVRIGKNSTIVKGMAFKKDGVKLAIAIAPFSQTWRIERQTPLMVYLNKPIVRGHWVAFDRVSGKPLYNSSNENNPKYCLAILRYLFGKGKVTGARIKERRENEEALTLWGWEETSAWKIH